MPPALAHDGFAGLLERARGERLLSGSGGEQPEPGALTLPIRLQECQGPAGQRHQAVFAPLAVAHPHVHTGRVDVGDVQLRPFPQA